MSKIVNNIPYSDKYPHIFATEKKRLASLLVDKVEIIHIGSTAIPGMSGKGIVDILLVTDDSLEVVAVRLKEIGLVSRENAGSAGRVFFSDKLLESSDVKFHYHLVKKDTADHLNPLTFRDYLSEHPEKAEDYKELKKLLAEGSENSRQYLEGKADFIKKILQSNK